jgi:ribosomal protein S18 acetylase RimI-like enzyme
MDELYPGGFVYIAAICVHPGARGRGVFGVLIDPLIAESRVKHLPLCLECYSEPLIDLYRGHGFQVVKTLTNEDPPLTQYCMALLP